LFEVPITPCRRCPLHLAALPRGAALHTARQSGKNLFRNRREMAACGVNPIYLSNISYKKINIYCLSNNIGIFAAPNLIP
jgi:hypothetical protein